MAKKASTRKKSLGNGAIAVRSKAQTKAATKSPRAAESHADTIVRLLRGERVDWAGASALLDLIDRTAGPERTKFIRSMGTVLHRKDVAPEVIAQLVQLASSLNLAEREPDVLAIDPAMAGPTPVKEEVANFLTFRRLRASGVVSPAP
jgi:hypothetical protein